MNARKAMFILGAVALALVAAVVAVALFSHKKIEAEKNSIRTEAARRERWKRETKIDEPKEPEPVSEPEKIPGDETV